MAIRPSSQTRASRQGAQGGDKDKGDEVTGETTSALTRADFLNELEAVPTVGPDSGAPVVEGLPLGSALLVVKRGPNAGSRFLLDRPVTSAARQPGSDVFLDDITVSRRHTECRWENDELDVVEMGSLNDTDVNRGEVHIGKFRLV